MAESLMSLYACTVVCGGWLVVCETRFCSLTMLLKSQKAHITSAPAHLPRAICTTPTIVRACFLYASQLETRHVSGT
jgi:hypothetical protein